MESREAIGPLGVASYQLILPGAGQADAESLDQLTGAAAVTAKDPCSLTPSSTTVVSLG